VEHFIIKPFYPMNEFEFVIERLMHLPGLHGNPRRTYPQTTTIPFLGLFHDLIPSIILKWYKSDNKAKFVN